VEHTITIIGGGLAGCEAAAQAARRGLRVRLFEMRPDVMTPAHRTGNLGELVCSSSLKSNSPETAHGLLKEEMRRLGSVALECAERTSVPGGDALCVDRDAFGAAMTQTIENLPGIEIVREEITEVPHDRPCIIASGPLTSPALTQNILEMLGTQSLHFFDAIAPSVDADSIDYGKVFRQSRYDKGEEAAYINCPMTREEYEAWIDALLSAELAHLHLEDDRPPMFGDLSEAEIPRHHDPGEAGIPQQQRKQYFEGCLPVEVIAGRGRDTLAHGAMKPVGLTDPHTGKRPYAVVQLRQENAEGSVWGLVGFQTQLKQSEQARVFRMIPGLENARFVRYGSVHRNTYIDSPRVLTAALHTKLDTAAVSGFPPSSNPETTERSPNPESTGLFFAGQIVGVEGYMESAASGIMAGINAARVALGEPVVVPPRETMIGALLDYIANCHDSNFQPMNSNFGILPEVAERHHKRDRKGLKIERARKAMDGFAQQLS
jgi:methylenetetrahydrofolate--tRNA-(uracil-5-)-methyltransferase